MNPNARTLEEAQGILSRKMQEMEEENEMRGTTKFSMDQQRNKIVEEVGEFDQSSCSDDDDENDKEDQESHELMSFP